MIMEMFVVQYGTFIQFIDIVLIGWYPLIDTVTTIPVQIFYLEKAYRLTKSRLSLVLLVPLMFANLTASILARALTTKITILQTGTIRWLYYLWIGSALLVDIITGTILENLLSARSGEPSSDRLANRLIRLCIESQLPSTLIVFGMMVSYGLAPKSTIFVVFVLFHSKLYAIPFFAVVNLRKTLREEFNLTTAEVEPTTMTVMVNDMAVNRTSLQYTQDLEYMISSDIQAKAINSNHVLPIELYGASAYHHSFDQNDSSGGSTSGTLNASGVRDGEEAIELEKL